MSMVVIIIIMLKATIFALVMYCLKLCKGYPTSHGNIFQPNTNTFIRVKQHKAVFLGKSTESSMQSVLSTGQRQTVKVVPSLLAIWPKRITEKLIMPVAGETYRLPNDVLIFRHKISELFRRGARVIRSRRSIQERHETMQLSIHDNLQGKFYTSRHKDFEQPKILTFSL